MPTFTSLVSVSETIPDGSLLRGFLWSSVIGTLMVTVAVYGFAILLNVQWLRLAGIYGLFCIFVKAWIMLATWLSTSSANWGMIANVPLNYLTNYECLLITPLIYYAWKLRTKIRIERSTYAVGMIASWDLFLVFSFFLGFILFNVGAGLTVSFIAIIFLVAAACSAAAFTFRKRLEFGLAITYLLIIGFVLPEVWATLELLLPLTLSVMSQNPWIFNILTPLVMIAAWAPVVAILARALSNFIVKRVQEARLGTKK